ncbi:MAG: GNAT family N-acetyltransferase [Clostridia bacterium]|nr:GNAT family N-acetyltransferase [Clostridia bacterium]
MNYTFEIFENKHVEKAIQLVGEAYHDERSYVRCLPKEVSIPSLEKYAANSLGISAMQGDNLVGFLCCLSPWDNFFGTSKGTFVPINAHATVRENRNNLYSLMYANAASIWVKKGILSHAIGVYAHDTEAVDSFFTNGFGLRTIDAVRSMEPLGFMEDNSNIKFFELESERYIEILPQLNSLIDHLNKSPNFMPHRKTDEGKFLNELENAPRRYFVAEADNRLIAHIKITESGESFIGSTKEMINIQGAYLEKEYRGAGVFQNLLDFSIKTLKNEGYSQIGVDFESFNPTARGFWLKYFTPYIYGLTRRIDERIVNFYE